MDFVCGIVVGFLIGMVYDMIKYAFWMKKIVIHVEPCIEPCIHPCEWCLLNQGVGESKESGEEQNEEELEEDAELKDIVAKVRKRCSQKSTPSPKSTNLLPLDSLFSHVSKLSALSMDEFMKNVPEENQGMMQGICRVLERASKGEKPSPEEIKTVRENMSDMFQRIFSTPITEDDKATERKDSEIILNRLQEIHESSEEKDEKV